MSEVLVQKKGVKGSYIGGGIFAVLFGLVLLFLYLPDFVWEIFTFQWVWDTSMVGINEEFMGFITSYLCYVGFPLLLFVITFVSIFIGVSKGSVFFKISTISSLLVVILNYVIKTLLFDVYNSMASFVNYINIGLTAVAFIFFVLGIVFMALQKTHPYRATSFHLFSAIFWILVCAVIILAGFLDIVKLQMVVANHLIPIALSLYGLIGGVWLFITCKRRIVIVNEEPVEIANTVASNDAVVGTPNPQGFAPNMQEQPQNNMPNFEQPYNNFSIQQAQYLQQQANQAQAKQNVEPEVAQTNNIFNQNQQTASTQQFQQPMAQQSVPQQSQQTVKPMQQPFNNAQQNQNAVPQNMQGVRPQPNGVPPMQQANGAQAGPRPMPQGFRPPYPPRPMPNNMQRPPFPPRPMAPQNMQGARPQPNGVPPIQQANGAQAGPRPMPQGFRPPYPPRPMPNNMPNQQRPNTAPTQPQQPNINQNNNNDGTNNN